MTKNTHKVNIPGYRIIRKVGEGGMSVVYLAYQESLKREVALKVMRPIITDEENVVRRFEQEAEIIAKLYHPNIVSIYEVGHIDDDILYYSMPYLQHGDLTAFAYNNDHELKKVMADICDGLAFAHTQGVVHRDIKPENILFDQFGHVQIADFGIALSTGRRRFTQENRIVGSIHYMSPEQAQSKHVDARSDIYGLGAILYEILTGDPVFDEDSDLSLMLAHVNNEVPQLPEHLSQWQAVIDKCLAKSPNHRYQNMAALKAAIESVNEEIRAPKKSFIKPIAVIAAMGILGVGAWFAWDQLQHNKTSVNQQVDVLKTPPVDERPVGQTKSQDQVDQLTGSTAEPVPEKDALPEVVNLLTAEQVAELVENAKKNIATKQLTTPRDDNALDQLLLLLSNLPNHQEGLSLLSDVMAGYYELVYQSVLKNDLNQAIQFAESVAEVRHRAILTNEQLLVFLEHNTELERSLLLGAIAEKVNLAKGRSNRNGAERLIGLVDAVMPGHEIIDELNASIESMPLPGQIIADKMGLRSVIVPPEINHSKGLIKYALAVSRAEISWQMFDQFVTDTGHEINRCKSAIGSNMIFSQRNYSKPGFRTAADMPVVCVTWQDANLFIEWYNKRSGENYRLPTILEWRHLIKLSDMKTPSCGSANLAGTEFPAEEENFKSYPCNDGFPFVAPYHAFDKNALGLIGFHGNVAEWLAGCQEMGKFKAIFNPEDQCESNPSAGYSWLSGKDDNGHVKQIKFDQAWSHIGFRLVKTL
ncbi:bifunctional serine/threonine-protein kinase/formylglycine-generating enzyme family protein [Marinicella litoralis]|uniref:Serine/threonine protein kinase n=1 Tax=Marinicella litoralis TaxID=644220 RepID=A0A4V3DGJ9_9GAMM|nr:bifunctional serine/threonine-protein kinase/formylglycine-generating enzyme family protein [Marinicella litoralis]TDR14651.1 serine/threonine protein kinase [Marinicella litoralis]